MAENYPRLRATGEWGGHFANLLTFLTTNWPVTLASVIAVGTGLNRWLWGVALTPAVYASAGVFLFVLWTVIGLTVLYDRRRPRKIQAHLDYRYGLTFEGFHPAFHAPNSGVPNAGELAFMIQIRNFSPGPIRYQLETLDIRLGTLASPKYGKTIIEGYMARGAGRTSNGDPFTAATVASLFGQGLINGTADFSILYGPPDGNALRRLKISLEIGIGIPTGGISGPNNPIVWSDKILSEVDDAI